MARACGCTACANPSACKTKNFPLFPLHSQTQTSLILPLLSLNLHYLNLQTSISLSKLHQIKQFLTQIISKHHSKHKPTIKTNIHPPKPQIYQIHNPFNSNPKAIISSPISIIKLKNLTKPPFPHKILPKPNLNPIQPKSNKVNSFKEKRKRGKICFMLY